MKFLLIKSISVLMFMCAVVGNANEKGNGGDEVRGIFIRQGNEIINFLENTDKGKALVKENELSIVKLQATLDIKKISLVRGQLTDNDGSIVSAQGSRVGYIRLDIDRWARFFETGNDVYYLVFHEMLRAAIRDDGSLYDDEGYKISININPFLEKKSTPALTNRGDGDSMFPNKTQYSLVEQSVLGIGEYIVFNYLHAPWAGVVPLNDVNIKHSEKVITNITGRLQNPNLKPEVRAALEKKLAKIKEELPLLRAAGANQAIKAAYSSNLVHNISFVAQGLIIVDMFGRVYVWTKLDRDPTLSPTTTYFWKKITK